MKTSICKLFKIKYPIIQGGMIWCSGYQLASAVSNAGGLGLIGAGSMYPEILREHIQKAKATTKESFGVNVPLLYPNTEEIIQIIIEEKVEIVFTSAGNPKLWTKHLQDHGIKVAHVIANSKFAAKCEEAGVDAIVAEGFEAGGHNGKEETTSLVLLQSLMGNTSVPIIAAGGFGTGASILAAFALGARGVQIGSLFAASKESSAHQEFKESIFKAGEGSTKLTLKQLTPVRLIKNEFFLRVEEAEQRGASIEELNNLLGRARAKRGMFEGDIKEGELEIGQISSIIKQEESAASILHRLVKEYNDCINAIGLLEKE